MRTWTVHLPREAAAGDPVAYDRAILVRDGFVWPAFFFTVLWMLWHRLWLAAILTLVVFLALSWGLPEIGVAEGPAFLIGLVVSALIGLEASTLRRWTYERRGLPVSDVVAAPDHDGADALACARFLARARPAETPPAPPAPAAVVTPFPTRPAAVDFGKRPPGVAPEPEPTAVEPSSSEIPPSEPRS